MRTTLEPAAPFDGEDVLPIADAKAHLRVDGDDEDAAIGAYRDAAIDWVERYSGCGLSQRSWVWTAARFADRMDLPMGPVESLTSVAYLDIGGAGQALETNAWRLAGRSIYPAPNTLWPRSLAGDGAVTVSFAAGYSNVASEAPALIVAVKLLLAHLYENREGGPDVPAAVTAVCRPYRTRVIG